MGRTTRRRALVVGNPPTAALRFATSDNRLRENAYSRYAARDFAGRMVRLSPIIGCLLLLACGTWVYYPTLAGPYVADDYFLLGTLVDEQGDLLSLPGSPYFYRPVYRASFLLDVLVFGADPFWSRLLNLGLHLSTALLLWRLFSRLTGLPAAAWVGAMLFALFPNATEPTVWVGARGDLLATWFSAAALVLFAGGLTRGFGLARALATSTCAAAAMCSKEPAMVLVPCMLALAWSCAPAADRTPWTVRLREVLRRSWWLLVVFAVYLVVRWVELGMIVGGYRGMQEAGFLETGVLSQKAFVLGCLAFPAWGTWSASWSPEAVGTVAALALAMVWLLGRKDSSAPARVIRWALVWLVVSLVVVHGISWPVDRDPSRYLYQASVAWCFLLPLAGHQLLVRWKIAPQLQWIGAVLLLCVAAVDLHIRVERYRESHRVADAVFDQVRDLYFDGGSGSILVHGLPDTHQGVLVARNSLPNAVWPPFAESRGERKIRGLTSEAVANGTGAFAVFPLLVDPQTVFAGWDADAEQLRVGERPDFPVFLTGWLRQPAPRRWTLEPGGVVVLGDETVLTSWRDQFVEIRGWAVERTSGVAVAAQDIELAEVGLSLRDDQQQGTELLVARGPGGVRAQLVAGVARGFKPLGAAGTLLIETPGAMPIGTFGADGLLEVPKAVLFGGPVVPNYCQLLLENDAGEMRFRDLIELAPK